jgi:hypothetical protein
MGPRSALLVAALLISTAPVSLAAEAKKDTLAFVVRDWFTAVYEGRFMDECPEGLNLANDEIWWRGLSKKDRARLTDNGLIQNLNRSGIAMRRGAHGEDVCLNPDAVTKPDPEFRTVEGSVSYGANLDGTTDGKATAKSCTHEKFATPDGVKGIDNQLYRLVQERTGRSERQRVARDQRPRHDPHRNYGRQRSPQFGQRDRHLLSLDRSVLAGQYRQGSAVLELPDRCRG